MGGKIIIPARRLDPDRDRCAAVITLKDDGLGAFTADIVFYRNGVRREVKHLPVESPSVNAGLKLAQIIVTQRVELLRPLPRDPASPEQKEGK